jgi:Zn-dependent protease
MDISADQVRDALLSLIAFIVAVSVHEFGHAFVADRLGDRIPRLQGRLTLSPMAHIDPIGTIILPLVGALMPGQVPLLAWGKPVQTNPMNYTRSVSRRTGHMLVALAGPVMNLVLAVVASVLFVALGKLGFLSPQIGGAILQYLLALNISLCFFNLLPLPPLDGAAVLAGILPESMQPIIHAIERYGIILLFVLIASRAMRVLMAPAMHLTDAWAGALVRMVSG